MPPTHTHAHYYITSRNILPDRASARTQPKHRIAPDERPELYDARVACRRPNFMHGVSVAAGGRRRTHGTHSPPSIFCVPREGEPSRACTHTHTKHRNYVTAAFFSFSSTALGAVTPVISAGCSAYNNRRNFLRGPQPRRERLHTHKHTRTPARTHEPARNGSDAHVCKHTLTGSATKPATERYSVCPLLIAPRVCICCVCVCVSVNPWSWSRIFGIPRSGTHTRLCLAHANRYNAERGLRFTPTETDTPTTP